MQSDTNSPDSALFVQFYEREIDIPYESEAHGRPIKRMTDWVKIQIPGNNTLGIDTIADGSHKKRFPQHWAQYQANKEASQIQGTLLKDWPALTAAQAGEMRHFKFYTVDQVAEGTDPNLVQVAAIAGMQPTAFREKAKAFLARAATSALAEHQAVELTKRDDQIKAMQEQINLLMSKLDAPKRGRPAKETEEA